MADDEAAPARPHRAARDRAHALRQQAEERIPSSKKWLAFIRRCEEQELMRAKKRVLEEWLPVDATSAPDAEPEDWPALLHGCGKLDMPPRARKSLQAVREWLPGDLTIGEVDRTLETIETIKVSDEKKAVSMLLELRSKIMHTILTEAGVAKASLRSTRSIPWYTSDSPDRRQLLVGEFAGKPKWVNKADAAEFLAECHEKLC